MGDVSLVGAPREIEIQATRLSGGAPASRVWRRGGLAYDPTNSAHSTDSRRDIDHAFSDELELHVDRDNTATLGYGQRSKRRDHERCDCFLVVVCSIRCDGLVVWFGDLGRRRNSHNHSHVRLSEWYSCRDCGDPRSS